MCKRLLAPIMLIVVGATPLAAQETEPDSVRPSRYFHSIHGLYSQRSQSEFDLGGAYGQALRVGSQATWLLRLEARIGFAFWGTTRDAGAMIGLHPGIVWSWDGLNDVIDFGGIVDLVLTADGGAYYTTNLAETPGERRVMPTVSGGLGFRFHGKQKLGTLEAMYEERIGVWEPRLFLRVGVYIPR
jgi:hypothetical protein